MHEHQHMEMRNKNIYVMGGEKPGQLGACGIAPAMGSMAQVCEPELLASAHKVTPKSTGNSSLTQVYNCWSGLPLSVLAGILEGLSWRDGCRAAAASRVFLEAGRSQRVLTFDGVDTESKARACSLNAP